MFSDELTEAILEEKVTEDVIQAAIRKATIALKLTPVFMGSAYKNKGVQLLLDGVLDYLPEPRRGRERRARHRQRTRRQVAARGGSEGTARRARVQARGRSLRPAHLHARLPGHRSRRGDFIVNARTTEKLQGRPPRAHALRRDGRHRGPAPGDIVALFGIDCDSGDTFTDGTVNVAMTSMHVPEPVISLAIKPKDSKAQSRTCRRRSSASRRRTRRSARTSTRSRTRRSSRAWASSTSTSTSSA